MQLSRHDTRALAVLALIICAAILSIECGEYFLRDVRDINAVGEKPMLVTEFGAGVPVSQSFTLQRDGLHSITVEISSDQAAVIGFEFALIRRGVIADWPDEPIMKRLVQMSVPAGITPQSIDFPPVSRSKDRTFVATFTMSDVMRRGSTASDPRVALTAWADDALRGGALKVGTADRWGDLAFSAQADPPTRLQRLTAALNLALAPTLHLGRTTLIVLAAAYGMLLAMVCYLGMRTWRRVGPSTTAVNVVALGDQPEKRTLHWIRVATTLSFAVATPLLFTAILVARERVSVNLLDRLDDARMESPAGMHVGFSRIEEVINGFSPPALFAHPPSRVTWNVNVPVQKPMFKTTIALRPYVWEHRSDGVSFDVTVTDGSHETRVTRFLNPGYRLNDRAWVEVAIDLSEYAGRSVDIALATSAGPQGDVGWDWALWGDPRIVSLRWFDRYPRAARVLNRDSSGD
jgi:hypothetical protein